MLRPINELNLTLILQFKALWSGKGRRGGSFGFEGLFYIIWRLVGQVALPDPTSLDVHGNWILVSDGGVVGWKAVFPVLVNRRALPEQHFSRSYRPDYEGRICFFRCNKWKSTLSFFGKSVTKKFPEPSYLKGDNGISAYSDRTFLILNYELGQSIAWIWLLVTIVLVTNERSIWIFVLNFGNM